MAGVAPLRLTPRSPLQRDKAAAIQGWMAAARVYPDRVRNYQNRGADHRSGTEEPRRSSPITGPRRDRDCRRRDVGSIADGFPLALSVPKGRGRCRQFGLMVRQGHHERSWGRPEPYWGLLGRYFSTLMRPGLRGVTEANCSRWLGRSNLPGDVRNFHERGGDGMPHQGAG